jgi:hypothetical protein
MLCTMAVCSRRINVFDRETVFKTELDFYELARIPRHKRSENVQWIKLNVWKTFTNIFTTFPISDNVFVTSLCDQDITKTSAQFS